MTARHVPEGSNVCDSRAGEPRTRLPREGICVGPKGARVCNRRSGRVLTHLPRGWCCVGAVTYVPSVSCEDPPPVSTVMSVKVRVICSESRRPGRAVDGRSVSLTHASMGILIGRGACSPVVSSVPNVKIAAASSISDSPNAPVETCTTR